MQERVESSECWYCLVGIRTPSPPRHAAGSSDSLSKSLGGGQINLERTQFAQP